MSTSIHDLASAAAVGAGQYPATITTTTNGPAVLLGGDGPCFAVQQVGATVGDTTLDGWVEQSGDGTTWSPVSGAAFATVAAASNLQVIRFTPSAKYVRWVGQLSGTTPSAAVAVVFGRQKKTF